MKKYSSTEFWISILLIAAVSALAFLPFAGKLGFFFNDWHPLSGQVADVSAYHLFKLERPGVGYLYDLTYMILGAHPLAWQLFTWLLRLAGTIVFFLLLRSLWPERKLETTLASLLMAVYPGFMQQPIALTFSNHFITLDTALLSIFFTVLALIYDKRWRRILYSLLALGMQLCYLFVYEYMLGLEALRLLLIGLILYRQERLNFARLTGKSLIYYLPYLIPLSGFLAWRMSFISSRPTTDLRVLGAVYQSNLVGMAGRLVLETLRDAFETAFQAWAVPLYQSLSEAPGWLVCLSFGAGLLAAGLIWLFLRRQVQPLEASDFTREWILVGGISLLAAVFPVVLSNREVRFDSLLDRYTLHAAASAILLLSGLIFHFLRPQASQQVHLVLVMVAVAAMLGNAYTYVQRWEAQRQTWWQLTWRAPQLKPDTALVAVLPSGMRLMEGSEIWTPANWIYYPGQGSLYLTGEVLDESSLQNIQARADAPRNFRNILFTNKFDQMLLISLSSASGCLHVLDGSQVESAGLEDKLTLQAAPYSLISQVMPERDPAQMPQFFGQEPQHNWCYDYQRASLARQQHNWTEVARLGDKALAAGYAPQDLSEWLPFIEGYWNIGRDKDALYLSNLIRADESAWKAICSNLSASHTPSGGYSDESIFQQMLVGLCNPE